MEEKIGKKFLLYFRLALLCWILIANAILHIIGFSYGWLIFISNIMLFTLEGDVKERFLTVEIGGLVGLVLTVLAMLAISALTPIVGDLFGLLIPLAAVLTLLILGHPYAPKVLNNVGFAYLTCACIDTASFASNIGLFILVFVVGVFFSTAEYIPMKSSILLGLLVVSYIVLVILDRRYAKLDMKKGESAALLAGEPTMA